MDKHPAVETIPKGLTLSLTRHQVVEGQEGEVDAWMAMLNRRAEECVATLDGEQMAIEAIFRLRDDAGDWLYWFELHGEGGGAITGDHPIDRDHLEFAKRCKEPGHVAAEPLVLLLPRPVRQAIVSWVNERVNEPK